MTRKFLTNSSLQGVQGPALAADFGGLTPVNEAGPRAANGVPGTLVVTSLADDGAAGTLRAALAIADAHPGETIVFASSLLGGTVTLGASLTVSASVTIEGLLGSGGNGKNITISGGGKVADFVTTGGTVVLANLNIVDGNGQAAAGGAGASGGGVGSNGGTGGQGGNAAGGILNAGAMLEVVNSDFVNDTATGGAGGEGGSGGPGFNARGVVVDAGGGGGGGAGGNAAGAIYTEAGSTALQSVRFSDDSAIGGTGGSGGTGGTDGLPGDVGGGGGVGGLGGYGASGETLPGSGGGDGSPGSGDGSGGGGSGGGVGQAGGAGASGSAGGGGGGGGGGNAAIDVGGTAALGIGPASAALSLAGGAGILSGGGGAYTLDLGIVAPGMGAPDIIDVQNLAAGLADSLGGTFAVVGGAAFTNTGFGVLQPVAAGSSAVAGMITVDAPANGSFTETLVYRPLDVLGGVGVGHLAPVTLTVTGTSGYVLSGYKATTITGVGNDTIFVEGNALFGQDHIDGGPAGTVNTMRLVGGGTYDLALPATLKDVQVLDVQEGQAAGGGAASTAQTVTLRSGLDLTVNVGAGPTNPSDPNPAGIFIAGAQDSSVINLGAGHDTVRVGAPSETVNCGSGVADILVTAATIGATLHGGSGQVTLNVLGGGVADMGSNITGLTDVVLNGSVATQLIFTANAQAGLVVHGGLGAETIIAGGAGQTLIAGKGFDHLIGSAAGSDQFEGTSALLGQDTVGNWLSGDTLDITDMGFSSATSLSYASGTKLGVLSVVDGSKSTDIVFSGALSASNFSVIGSDGHGGLLIGFHG